MQLYACIHISDGKSVNPNDVHHMKNNICTLDPVELALHWQEAGATYLHIFDLDGFAMNQPVNSEAVRNILGAVHIPVQHSGGITNIRDIDFFLNMGVSRVALNAGRIYKPNFFKEALQCFGDEKLLAAIDADQGIVAIEGRDKISNFNALALAQQVEQAGMRSIIYRDVVCETRVKSPDFDNTRELVDHTRLNVIYAGGISTLQDIEQMEKIGVGGVIIGAALYANKLNLKEAVMLYER